MSSRALRKLHGEKDEFPHNLEDGDSEEEVIPRPVNNKKKKKGMKVPLNPFDMLPGEEDADIPEEEQKESKENKAEEDKVEETTSTKHKKKKKKKNKKNKMAETKPENGDKDEDDFESAIREVNEMLGELPARSSETAFNSDDGITMNMRSLLNVEHRNLNPDNEMRRIFGSRVVQSDARRRARGRGAYHRTTWLTTPKDTWPHMGKTGLSMSLLDSRQGNSYFTFEHNAQYQKTQGEFWDAVETLQPQAIMNVLNLSPYHIDSLLQLSEVCKMSEDMQMATELIERALYAMECSFHPSFSLTKGNCRLDYRRMENRAFYLALFRHLVFIGERACYRTALEFCKLILSFDPDGDPLCMLLLLDFYALQASEYDFLVRMGQEWEGHRNLSQLPNFAFSVALSMFQQAQRDSTDTAEADVKLQEALISFPGLLIPLLDRCNVVPAPAVAQHAFFGSRAQTQQPPALKQLISLYVGRCFPCWKAPEVLTWLERTCIRVMERADRGDAAVQEAEARRSTRYQGTPRNIHRHIVLSEIKEALSALPPEVSNSPILSYDPLPPPDAIVTYTRRQRRVRAQEDSGALSMFFRSLLPNFNPQEPAAPAAAAAGGEGGARGELQQGVGALMDAMRELLHNIRPVAPPVEGRDEREDGADDQDQEWD